MINHLEKTRMKNELVRKLVRNAFVAANYVVLTYATSAISFGPIQVRISEALVLLCFFRKDYIWGLTIGCLIANLFSPYLPWDLIVGTLATFFSCLCICFCKRLFIAGLFPVVFNAFAVGAEIAILDELPFWLIVGEVGLGEFIAVCIVGYLLYLLLRKNQRFFDIIGANQNLEFKW